MFSDDKKRPQERQQRASAPRWRIDNREIGYPISVKETLCIEQVQRTCRN